MQKQAPSVGRILTMVLFALSCFGLLLFLWLSFGGPTPGTPEGYLFWIAWLGHNAGAVFSTADATGIFRPVAIQATCATIKQTINDEPELEFLQGLTGALFDPRICAAG